MSDERFHHQIRLSAKELEDAEMAVHRADAMLKKTVAEMKLRAKAAGVKTQGECETYADQSEEVFRARLDLGVAEARRAAARVELKAREADLEEEKMRQYSLMREMRRYGA